jgi:hypothetical protein
MTMEFHLPEKNENIDLYENEEVMLKSMVDRWDKQRLKVNQIIHTRTGEFSKEWNADIRWR